MKKAPHIRGYRGAHTSQVSVSFLGFKRPAALSNQKELVIKRLQK